MIRLSILLIFFSHSLLSSFVSAQTIPSNLFSPENLKIFQENPALLDQFNNIESSKSNELEKSMLSENKTTLNEYDLKEDQNVLYQNIETESKLGELDEARASNLQNFLEAFSDSDEKNYSVIQEYFKTLTGDILDVYGSREFSQPQDDSVLFFNTIGENYLLAPGDSLQITYRGLRSFSNVYNINNHGTITIENISPIYVSGLTLKEVKASIQKIMLLDDASAEVFVSLDAARLITVQISGNVNYPKTLAVPAYTPLSRVLAYSGGISDYGSLRNIFLSQSDETTKTVDFYNFLQSPSNSNDPLIGNNARIFVPNKGPTIAASGFVARPGIYELNNSDTEMTVGELLKLTGTNFIPSGTILKSLSIDDDGNATSRIVKMNDKLKMGEALDVDFIETQNLNNLKVSGAVLENYSITSNSPLSIKSVLKNGGVLSDDAFTSFALITGTNIQNRAINLKEALSDERILLPLGGHLTIFNQFEYMKLVAADPNNTLEPLMSDLKRTDVSEIYLNGKRIAYLAPSQNVNLSESINAFYKPNPKTIFDIAVIKNDNGVRAFSLRYAIQNKNMPSLKAGEQLFIFEKQFYDNLLKIYENNSSQDSVELYSAFNKNINSSIFEESLTERLEFSKKIIQEADLVKVMLNDKLFAILPFNHEISSQHILNILKGRLPNIINEFSIVLNRGVDEKPKIINLNDNTYIKNGQSLHLITQQKYETIIEQFFSNYKSNLISNIRASDAVKVFYDGRLSALVAPNYYAHELFQLSQFNTRPNFYRLYIGLKSKPNNQNSGSWSQYVYSAERFFSKNNLKKLGPEDRISFYSEEFIRSEFISKNSQPSYKEGVDLNLETSHSNKDIELAKRQISNLDIIDINRLPSTINLEDPKVVTQGQNIEKTNDNIDKIGIISMKNSSRVITGAVQYPGSYPVADEIKLINLINAAGGLVSGAEISKITNTKAFKENNRLVRAKPEIYDLSDIKTKNITLSGMYYIDIPYSINDAVSGVIEIGGEVLIPGTYTFARNETLKDILTRAGGLSEVAYPLGAVFERESVKAQEENTNQILANQLESSVLTLAQSDIEGVGDQINAVLGFANQLRNQKVTGRMALNILDSNVSTPLYLQDGDKLTVPKRPSHVSIVGSVQNTTMASYKKDNTYKDYLRSAGGATKVADMRKAYLLLPNGESTPVNSSTIIPAGAVLVIPPKIDKISVLGLTTIISRVMGNIATSILAINNVK